MFREHPGCMSSCAEPLQTDLSSVTGRQLKSPPHPPHPRQPPPSSNRRSAYPRRAHIGTLSNLTHVHLLEPRLFKDISGILTRSHDSEGNGSVRLSLQSRTEAGAGAHTGSCRTNTVRARIAPAGVPWCPLPKTHLGSCWISMTLLWAESQAGAPPSHFSCWAIILFPLLAFSVTWYLTVTLLQGKNITIVWRWPKSLLCCLRKGWYQCGWQLPSVPFRGIEARFSLWTVGIEGCMKVIAVARWALDIDSLWMLFFIDEGKCWAQTWLTCLVIQNTHAEGIWYSAGVCHQTLQFAESGLWNASCLSSVVLMPPHSNNSQVFLRLLKSKPWGWLQGRRSTFSQRMQANWGLDVGSWLFTSW